MMTVTKPLFSNAVYMTCQNECTENVICAFFKYLRILMLRNSHLTRIDNDVNVGRVWEVGDWSTGVGA